MSLNKFTIQKSFAINAGAGSGKTYTLSRRYINALLGFDFLEKITQLKKVILVNIHPQKSVK
jgi:ATP-dependent exoDNAse (exonuclease V) beta subunit